MWPQSPVVGGGPPPGVRVRVALLVALLLVLVYLGGRKAQRERFTLARTRPVVARADGAPYRVHLAHAGPEAAADALAGLNAQAIALLRHLRRRYGRRGAEGGDAGGDAGARGEATRNLLARYNPDNLAENSPRDPTGDTAYSLDKGAVLAICLRSRTDPAAGLHAAELLSFVMLHEMAHVAVDVLDHPPEFWRTFRWLLEEAEEAGLYRSPRFAEAPQNYCGIHVDYNPRHDPAVAPI